MKYCSKCGTELLRAVKYCSKCGNEIKFNIKVEKQLKDNKTNDNDTISLENNCPQCDTKSLEKLKKGLLSSTQYYLCSKCKYKGPLLLKTSDRIGLAVLTIIVVIIIIGMMSGEGGAVGWLGILGVVIFINDYSYRKKVDNYRITNNLPKYIDGEKNGLIKGIIYSAIIVIIFFTLSSISE